MIVSKKIKQAVKKLKNGGLVAFPTETVYGLGARLYDAKAIEKVFSAKKRPNDNPLILHIAEHHQLDSLVERIPFQASKLIQKFWPGPLTLIFHKSDAVPLSVTAGLNTVAVRMPSHPTAHRLLKVLGEPVAAPSANRSGRPSSTQAHHVVKELKGWVDLVLDGVKPTVGLESTVVDVISEPFRILRPGSISLEDLKKVVPSMTLYTGSPNKSASPSPGLRHRHYQPSYTVILANPNDWKDTIKRLTMKNLQMGVLSFSRKIPFQKNIIYKRDFRKNKEEYARKLYSYFHEAEKKKVQVLVAEPVSSKGIGLAIMDRLSRASSRT